jgi:hypothetical protein
MDVNERTRLGFMPNAKWTIPRIKMARKTDGEKLDELIPLVAALQERLDRVRDDVKELQRDQEESRRRLWMIVPPLLAALLSAGLTAAVNFFSR